VSLTITFQFGSKSYSCEFKSELEAKLVEIADLVKLNQRIIMTSLAQHAADLQAVIATIEKIGTETTELLKLVATLQAEVANAGNTTPEIDAAMAALTEQSKKVDDLIPDATPVPAPGV
jgi:hypothetical protein